MSHRLTEDADSSVPQRPQQPSRGDDAHREAVQRLLWTPTEGQDVTKSYFPLSESSDNAESD
jgi:hypothetical protein